MLLGMMLNLVLLPILFAVYLLNVTLAWLF